MTSTLSEMVYFGAEANLKKVGPCAVKTFFNECCWQPSRIRNPKKADELANQATLLQSLNFPFFPRIIAHYHTKCPLGQPSYIWELEWVDGVTFKTYLERYQSSRKAYPDPLTYLASLEASISSLHQTGYSHGDLHWENLILAPNGEVKLIDLTYVAPANDSSIRKDTLSTNLIRDGFREMAGLPKLYDCFGRAKQ